MRKLEMTKKLITGLAKDIGKSVLIGVTVGLLVAVVLWIAGFLTGGLRVLAGAKAARTGLFIVGALGLFVLAGANLFKQGQAFSMEDYREEWKNHFSVAGFKTVLGIASVAVLGIASFLDYVIYYL